MLSIYVLLSVWLSRAELGDLATWVGALANVATLAFALVAAIVGFRVYKIESGRDRRAEDERRERALDERQGQASLVSVWFDKETTNATPRLGRVQWPMTTWGAHILNASTLPIYDVLIFFRFFGLLDTWTGGQVPVVPPHKRDVQEVLPQEMWDLIRLRYPHGIDGLNVVRVAMEFRDSAGRRWHRDWDGVLSELPNYQLPVRSPRSGGADVAVQAAPRR
ncbi:hypothetical protein OOJ91_12420 [Micromonospora lupini]|uniref:hypothetical protein n=1 Tax=Micromonospora lupini TaxID=285679 RepID=UPI0022576A0A|nr:hypothetical protein [Micromonospora lupini]MCX5066684.1 hypothetical protein [Micromonospora lupini]